MNPFWFLWKLLVVFCTIFDNFDCFFNCNPFYLASENIKKFAVWPWNTIWKQKHDLMTHCAPFLSLCIWEKSVKNAFSSPRCCCCILRNGRVSGLPRCCCPSLAPLNRWEFYQASGSRVAKFVGSLKFTLVWHSKVWIYLDSRPKPALCLQSRAEKLQILA